MADLSDVKRKAIAALLNAAPDRLLTHIEVAFRSVPGPAAAFVRRSAREASIDRQARAMVFAPLLPLFAKRTDGLEAETFPRKTLLALWAALAVSREAEVAQVRVPLNEVGPSRVRLEALDGLCAAAALEVRMHEPAALGLADEAQAQSLAAYLELAPRARSAVDLVDAWTGGQLDGESARQIRLAFEDAAEIHAQGVRRMMEILFAHLVEGGMVLRLVTTVTERSGAPALDQTELGVFGDRLASYVEAKAAALGALLKSDAIEDAEAAATGMRRAASILNQFDLAFGESGPWTARLTAARARLGQQLDSFFRGVDRSVEKALPLASVQLLGRMSRKAPDLSADLASPAANTALAALIVVDGANALAPLVGAEAARQGAIRAVGERTDRYADELLNRLPDTEGAEREAAMALTGMAARFLDLTQGEAVGALVRRRMTSAVLDRSDEAA